MSGDTLFVFSLATLALLLLPGPAVMYIVMRSAIWLGIESVRSYRAGDQPKVTLSQGLRPLRRVFWDGVVLNVLNPKTAVFFLSFVPQFIDPASATPAVDVAVLGGLFIVLGLISDGAYALAGGWVGSRLRRSPRLRRGKDLVAGGTYLGLGAATALTSK